MIDDRLTLLVNYTNDMTEVKILKPKKGTESKPKQIQRVYCEIRFNPKTPINKKTTIKIVVLCERERIRTFDRLLRRQMLYPAELRTHW